MTSYNYNASDFTTSGGKCLTEYLVGEIQKVLGFYPITATFESPRCTIDFAGELTPAQKALLDGVITAHKGAKPTSLRFHASSTICQAAVNMPADGDWHDLGGVVTNPAFFVPNLTMALGRVVGEVKTSATGCKLRVVTKAGAVILSADLADTADDWAPFAVTSQPGAPLTPGESLFLVQAQVPANEACAFAYTSFTLLEIVP